MGKKVDTKAFGALIRSWRDEDRRTRDELALRVCETALTAAVTARNIEDWERGKGLPRIKNALAALRIAFNADPTPSQTYQRLGIDPPAHLAQFAPIDARCKQWDAVFTEPGAFSRQIEEQRKIVLDDILQIPHQDIFDNIELSHDEEAIYYIKFLSIFLSASHLSSYQNSKYSIFGYLIQYGRNRNYYDHLLSHSYQIYINTLSDVSKSHLLNLISNLTPGEDYKSMNNIVEELADCTNERLFHLYFRISKIFDIHSNNSIHLYDKLLIDNLFEILIARFLRDKTSSEITSLCLCSICRGWSITYPGLRMNIDKLQLCWSILISDDITSFARSHLSLAIGSHYIKQSVNRDYTYLWAKLADRQIQRDKILPPETIIKLDVEEDDIKKISSIFLQSDDFHEKICISVLLFRIGVFYIESMELFKNHVSFVSNSAELQGEIISYIGFTGGEKEHEFLLNTVMQSHNLGHFGRLSYLTPSLAFLAVLGTCPIPTLRRLFEAAIKRPNFDINAIAFAVATAKPTGRAHLMAFPWWRSRRAMTAVSRAIWRSMRLELKHDWQETFSIFPYTAKGLRTWWSEKSG